MTTAIIAFLCIVGLFGYILYSDHKRQKKKDAELQKSLEDETLYVEGVGKVNFEDLGEMAQADPDDYLGHYRNPLYEEGREPEALHGPIKNVPLSEERRLSIDDAFLYVQELLGKNLAMAKPVLTPGHAIFPQKIEHLEEIIPLAHTIAGIMDIDPDKLDIGFFEAGIRELNKDTGDLVYWDQEDYAGLYHGVNEAGKYVVTISDDIHREVEHLVATLAHEFAHIKLLGEQRMEENDEDLTDLVPLLYGLGIFAANTAFKFEKDQRGWRRSTAGYLGQADWGYLFALYLHTRGETEPGWLGSLNKTVAAYSRRSLQFVQANPHKVLLPARP